MNMWYCTPTSGNTHLLGADISKGFAQEGMSQLAWPMFIESLSKFTPETTNTILHVRGTTLLATQGDRWLTSPNTIFSDTLLQEDKKNIFICVAAPRSEEILRLIKLAGYGNVLPVLFMEEEPQLPYTGADFNMLKRNWTMDRLSLYYIDREVEE